MNRLVISIGIITLVILIAIGIVAYTERAPTQNQSSSIAQNGFQPLDRGGVNSSSVPIPGQAQTIPYATTPTPTPQPIQQTYQQTIVTTQPVNFSEPFIQYTQPSQPAPQQIFTEQTQTYVPPAAPIATEPVIVEATATAQTQATTSSFTIPNLNKYIPYSGPVAPAAGVPASSGGGGGSSDDTTSILVSVGVGILAYLIGGPILGALLGEGISALFGGGGGGGGGLGAIFGGGGGGGSGNFGGKITNVTYCTCSASLMLDVDDVRGQMLSLIFSPGQSKLYEDYNVFEAGPEVLGTYSGGGQCEVYSGESCNSQGNPQGTIDIVGTSE